MAGVSPVFFKNEGTERLSILEVCEASEKVAGDLSILGAQQIGALWRIYAKSSVARMTLLSRGIGLRGRQISLLARNPFLLTDDNGDEVEVTRLFIGNIPISFSNEEIGKALKKAGVVARAPIVDEHVRDLAGHMTNWVSGRRMVWIDIPKVHL